MKKSIYLTMLLLLAVTMVADAQGYRRWDFTKWSQQTIDNLIAESEIVKSERNYVDGWSDVEYTNNPGNAVGNKCFWLQDSENYGTLKANGQVISELEGLDFGQAYCGARALAIAVDYQTNANNWTYAGPQYLWLGNPTTKSVCFTIHNVAIGEKMTFVVESHRNGTGRGIALYVGEVSDATRIGDEFTPDAQESRTWEGWAMPEGASDPDGDGLVDILVQNTHGCHIYTIEIGENTEARSVGYLYDGDLTADLGYATMIADYNNNVTAIQADKALTMEELDAYDAIVVSSTVTNADAVASLWQLQPFLPMLNLNAELYPLWGCGEVTDSGADVAVVSAPTHNLFKGVDVFSDEAEEPTYGIAVTTDMSTYPCVKPSGLFAADAVLATAFENPEAVAIHTHNMGHNGYIYLPFSQQVMGACASPQLLSNAVKLLASSKAPVTQAPAPTFSLQYENMSTNVTIACNVPGAEIFYTIDGTDPTEQSTRYTEPFTLTEVTTVKAVARGDGYLLSTIGEQEVDLKAMAPMPTIAMEQQDGKTIVTISSELEGAKIYYNYKGDGTTAKSSPYNGPVSVTRGRTIYAFQACEGYLDSKVAQAEVHVQNPHIRIDVLSQMDSNQETYYELTNKSASNVGYYFSWANTNDYPYWNPEFDETVPDSQGGDSIIHHQMNPEEVVDFQNGWSLRSRGQRVSWEGANPEQNYGNANSVNPASVEDEDPYLPVTPYIINLFDWNTQYPASAKIQTTQPIAGPFDYTAYIINFKGSPAARLVVEVATDAEADDAGWKQLGDTLDLNPTRRLYQKYVRSYEETTPVYTRVRIVNNGPRAGFFNIYITNEGEESKKLIEEQQSGIAVNPAAPTLSQPAAIYDLSGVRRQQMQHGLNIVRRADGTIRKVLVK